MSGYVKEEGFLIAEGEEGALYIFLDAKKDHPKTPRIIYDGRDHAIFLRSMSEKIILDYIHPEVRNKLRKAYDVIVVETLLENIKETYRVEMNIVDQIPLDFKKIGLTTWEEAYLSQP